MTSDMFESKVKDLEKKSYKICDSLLSKPLVVLPAGRFYRLSIRVLDMWGIRTDFLTDSNPSKTSIIWKYKGRDYIPQITDEFVKKMGNSVNYIITSRPFREEIKNQLLIKGIEPGNIFYMPVRLGDLVSTSSFRRRYEIKKAFGEIEKACNMLDDEESKNELWTLMAIFYANAPVWIESIPSEEYFNTPYLKIGQGEVFVDAGMFDGGTSERFAKLYPNYDSIYGIEANPMNMEVISKRLNEYRDVKIYNNALCNTTDFIRFQREGIGPEGAKVSENGEIVVKGMRGDDMDITPTFIKFDIEGAEYDALLSFEKTIKKCRPKMAVSAYHSLEDHWRLILLIKRICPEYKLYMKHHYGYEDLYGTILYASIESKD